MEFQPAIWYICRMVKPVENPAEWQDEFLKSLVSPLQILDLFDQLPGIYMYVKDVHSRFVHANQVVCDIVGVAHPGMLIGKTDFDFFPPAVAAQYVEEDQRVIGSGKPLRDQVWLVPGQNGVPLWYLCNKAPLFAGGKVVGIAGVKRPYENTGESSAGFSRLMKVVAYVSQNYHRPIEVSDLAAHTRMSVSQLQREFSRHFGITPVRYIREVRIGVARHLLETSDKKMSQIAASCGFYDQSHFSRQFKSSTGTTPLRYRQRDRQLRPSGTAEPPVD